jgi:hypothetical protein
MCEATEEGLQRLYWACRSNSGFPGDVLDESQGSPSTAAILNALGLMTPSLEDTGQSEDIQRPAKVSPSNSTDFRERSRHQHQTATSPAGESSIQDEYLPSPTTTFVSIPSSPCSPKTRPSLPTMVLPSPNTPPEMDMSEQFIYATSESPSSSRSPGMNKREYCSASHPSEPAFNMDFYVDTGSCSIPPSDYLTYDLFTSVQYDIPTTKEAINHIL